MANTRPRAQAKKKGSRKGGHTKRSGNTKRIEQMVDSKNVAERLEDEVTHEETRGSFHSVQCIQSSFSVPTIFDKFLLFPLTFVCPFLFLALQRADTLFCCFTQFRVTSLCPVSFPVPLFLISFLLFPLSFVCPSFWCSLLREVCADHFDTFFLFHSVSCVLFACCSFAQSLHRRGAGVTSFIAQTLHCPCKRISHDSKSYKTLPNFCPQR